MRFRSSFVTNSSSSSFITITVRGNEIIKILEKYKKCLEENDVVVTIEDKEINGVFYKELSIQGDDIYIAIPYDGDDMYDPCEYCNGEDCDECPYESGVENVPNGYRVDVFATLMPNERDFLNELNEHRKELINDVEYLEINRSDVGYGEDESRYEEENYTKESLKYMYEKIMKSQGYSSIEEVTANDFSEYVSSDTSMETSTFVYDKQKGISHSHTFELL